MKKTKWMTIAAAVTLSASLAFAAPHDGMGGGGKRGRHGRHGGQMFGQRMAEKLQLTEAQQQQIKELNESFRESNKQVFENAKALHKEMRAAKDAGDTAKLESLKPQMEAQRAQMKQLHDAQMQRVVTVLTPDQRTKWEAMKAEREARRGQRGPRGNRD